MRFFKPIANVFFILLLKIMTPIKVDFGAKIADDFFFFCMKKRLTRVNLRNVILGRGVKISEGVSFFNSPEIFGKVNIGRYTSISGPSTRVSSRINAITIGSFCSIASGVVIQEYYHNIQRATSYNILSNIFSNKFTPVQEISKGPVVIEDDVWIGSNAVILSGIKIGRGAVIGAGAIVTKNVDAYTIVAGNPARLIRRRFSDATIELLENSLWWEWDRDKIIQEKEFFSKEYI
ncbi:MAG: antibiotic acetyltransferase [Mucilaginibacter sp.]|nr:antibiotic acetyltransferase [Mucilaginibacter sp.]